MSLKSPLWYLSPELFTCKHEVVSAKHLQMFAQDFLNMDDGISISLLIVFCQLKVTYRKLIRLKVHTSLRFKIIGSFLNCVQKVINIGYWCVTKNIWSDAIKIYGVKLWSANIVLRLQAMKHCLCFSFSFYAQ